MNQPSLADQAVTTLAQVRAIGELCGNDHPMRHVVRNMKRTSEQILADAMRQASDIAYQAKCVIKDYDDAAKEDQ